MQFSVLIATRNRPGLFERAIASVLANRDADFEVIVIDDGTEPPFREQLDRLEARLVAAESERVRFHHLPHRERGHGPSYVLNYAASRARGDYLCFLDDDDLWIDTGYLACATAILACSPPSPDLLFFDQVAFAKGRRLSRAIWLEDLGCRLRAVAPPDQNGAYEVTVGQLLTAASFCHVNTTIVRRSFYGEVGGFDQAIRYEGDRDFYLRAIDRASLIKYVPRLVAQHNVPDAHAKRNVSTAVSETEKLRDRLTGLEKAARDSRHVEIASYAREHRIYTLKRLAFAAYAANDLDQARTYAWRGLHIRFNIIWLFFTLYVSMRARSLKHFL
ncbi:conserved hypothetical protein [uncultured Defluviicoccus sp.]|uniref:Glycosyltransferase 2-like domain-containing protein n=1 Tax=metagenome TaxID=256318 RepID=A0A380TC96_9ZZZZ|nr:conserved hypothetical protein [uncultured Defluviicoccus sp.]